jgi:hypothetical protein
LYSCCRTDEHLTTYQEVTKQLTAYLGEVNAQLAAKGILVTFALDTVDGELVVFVEAR